MLAFWDDREERVPLLWPCMNWFMVEENVALWASENALQYAPSAHIDQMTLDAIGCFSYFAYAVSVSFFKTLFTEGKHKYENGAFQVSFSTKWMSTYSKQFGDGSMSHRYVKPARDWFSR